MVGTKVAPYGSWKSPITSALIVAESVRLLDVYIAEGEVYWVEMRPGEGGRCVIVRRGPDGGTQDVNPPPFNARTRVHEYGGQAFAVHDGAAYFSNFADQRIYRAREGGIEPVTREGNMRFADFAVDDARGRLVCVCEDHGRGGQYPVNTICAVPPSGGAPAVLVEGCDFYSNPRLSPDGKRLAWLQWNHPNMPWDGTGLWVGEIREDGSVEGAVRVAGGGGGRAASGTGGGEKGRTGGQATSGTRPGQGAGTARRAPTAGETTSHAQREGTSARADSGTDSEGESIFQPEWSPGGVLHFVSDRTGWWNLYRMGEGGIEALCGMEAEFGMPQWVFGMSTYGFESAGGILCAYTKDGTWRLARLDTASRGLDDVEAPYTQAGAVKVSDGRAVFIAASPGEAAAVVEMDLGTLERKVLRKSTGVAVDEGYISAPEAIEFPTENGLTAHALFYAPTNRDCEAPGEEKPPLLVHIHGGPTSAAGSGLSLSTQYWTSRGFAVADVNYGGSTGYGREYRKRLDGRWGVVDVDDCCNAARYLVRAGRVDGERLAIAGGSAGGYTTLCALAFRDVFGAGASHFGVSDAEGLANDTHKFESRYLDRLIGPYPAERDLYVERSPVHFPERLSCPVIFFQGLEDRIVPPDQAEKMVEALKAKGVAVAYVAFEGEQHGFRRAEHIRRALDGEFYFYSRVFGFEPAEKIEPVEIYNLD